MQTFLINSLNQTFIEDSLNKFKKNLKISPYNFHEIIPAPSIGINEVRKLNQLCFLKLPLTASRLIVIREIDKATLAAQNALLKILEEPPSSTYFVLTTSNLYQILPTITSRCQLINDINLPVFDSVNNTKNLQLIKSLLRSSNGDRIELALVHSKTKEEVVILLNSLITILRSFLYDPKDEINLTMTEISILLKKISSARNYIEKNVNFKSVLEILFLGFPKKEKF